MHCVPPSFGGNFRLVTAVGAYILSHWTHSPMHCVVQSEHRSHYCNAYYTDSTPVSEYVLQQLCHAQKLQLTAAAGTVYCHTGPVCYCRIVHICSYVVLGSLSSVTYVSYFTLLLDNLAESQQHVCAFARIEQILYPCIYRCTHQTIDRDNFFLACYTHKLVCLVNVYGTGSLPHENST